MFVYKEWVKRDYGKNIVYVYEGWFFLWFIPVFIKRLGRK